MNDRQRKILGQLSGKQKVMVSELVDMMGVSGVTIRQDLEILQKQGFVQRIHGGAVWRSEDEITGRLGVNYEIKSSIARRASTLIGQGETLFIEAGSANALFARQLVDFTDLTVVTNNVFITRLLKDSEVDVILLGGNYQHQSECVVGPLALRGVEMMNFDRIFLGVDGISVDSGLTCSHMLRGDVSRAALKNSKEVLVLTDSSKIGKTATYKVCSMDDVHCLVTDSHITDDQKESFQQIGVNVIVAQI